MTPELAEQAYLNLMRNLPPEVAARVSEKYAQEREDFVNYVAEVKPSESPDYWANKSCTKCYGRGIIGVLAKPDGEKSNLVCGCTEKKYSKWLVQTRIQYNKVEGQ